MEREQKHYLSIQLLNGKKECFKSSLNNKVGNYLNEYANQRLNVTSSVSDNHKSASTVHTQPKNSSRSWRLKGLQKPQEPTELLTSLWCCGQSDIGISIWSGLVSEFNTSVVAPADCSTGIGNIHSKAYPGNKYPPEEHPLGYLFIHSKQRLSLFILCPVSHTKSTLEVIWKTIKAWKYSRGLDWKSLNGKMIVPKNYIRGSQLSIDKTLIVVVISVCHLVWNYYRSQIVV